MQIVGLVAKSLGVDKIPSASHYLTLCGEEVNRHIFNMTHQGSPHKKADIDRKKYIAIFRARYLEKSDYEYSRAITGVEGKMIEQLNNLLVERGFDTDEYLKWLFEVFAENPNNQKFMPVTIKFSCSAMCTDRFFYENKDMLKKKREDEVRKKKTLDLINRSRVLIRESSKREDVEIVKIVLRDYRDGRIMSLDEFSDRITAIETERAGKKCQ
jgi:hypothetical protein